MEVFAPVPIYKLKSRTCPISLELGYLIKISRISDLTSIFATPGFDLRKIPVTLSDRAITLKKDFMLLILAKNKIILISRALLEPYLSLSDYSILMVTITPQELFASKIVIENIKIEIIFLADSLSSMYDKIDALISIIRVF